ncbi:HAD family hydrolase [Paenibacillus sp. LHD-117]|uniref:HAD family hydrolase n=1 Tax=Paenibacillus sp. LHD-117 TaxID=3071412 RepID=UPI0027DEAF4E|nr:HAD family hydrolase [Paenibacillus sp. LHD-117]MDQ6422694.1 HAD family hydrolase [Paenibacillus sp. LHD-117]
MNKAVFFDVDDTLYDHLLPFRKAVSKWVSRVPDFPYEKAYHRLRYYSDILSLELGGAGMMEAGDATEGMRRRRFQLTLAEFGIELSEEESAEVQAAYIGCQYDIEMFPGARELMAELAATGTIVGLVTNGAGPHQRRKIEAMRLEGLIAPENIFVSGEVGWDKPDARIFRYINEVTGTKPEDCVYIGDSWRNDVIGALAADWTVVWFNHRGTVPETDDRPHHIVAGYKELAGLFSELCQATLA